jgi:hypothetical protein
MCFTKHCFHEKAHAACASSTLRGAIHSAARCNADEVSHVRLSTKTTTFVKKDTMLSLYSMCARFVKTA